MLKSYLIPLILISLISLAGGQLAAQETAERIYKVSAFAKHAPELTQEAFNKQMKEKLLPHLSKLPSLLGLTANLTKPGQSKAPYAAVMELWFDDASSYKAAWQSKAGKEAMQLLQTLIDGELQTMPVYEAKMIYPPTTEQGTFDGYKRVYVAYHNPRSRRRSICCGTCVTMLPLRMGCPVLRATF